MCAVTDSPRDPLIDPLRQPGLRNGGKGAGGLSQKISITQRERHLQPRSAMISHGERFARFRAGAASVAGRHPRQGTDQGWKQNVSVPTVGIALRGEEREISRMTRSCTIFLAALAICIAAPVPAAAQVIVGRVIDAATGGGVPRARVTVSGVDHRETQRTLTGDNGRFTFVVRGGGSYRVRVARTGYQDAATRALDVGPGDTVAVTVRATAEPRRLDPVVVSTPPRRLAINGVYEQTDITSAFLATRTTGEGGRRNVTVRGAMPTPSACWRLSGGADRIGPVITLAVNARPTGAACPPDSPGASTYKVTVRGIPPGTYTLRVLHTYRNDAVPRSLALDTTITVR
jgi:hypothetical protein